MEVNVVFLFSSKVYASRLGFPSLDDVFPKLSVNIYVCVCVYTYCRSNSMRSQFFLFPSCLGTRTKVEKMRRAIFFR